MVSAALFSTVPQDHQLTFPSFDVEEDDDLSITGASHASHFLLRTLRCEGEDLDRAIRLYHHPDVVRGLAPELLRDVPEARRAAISLREGTPSPCVIISREGAFVTCLGEGMMADLPSLPYASFTAAMDRADREQERARRRVRQLRDLPIERLTRGLSDGYGHVSREMIQVLLIDPHTYLLPVSRLCIHSIRALAKVMLAGRVRRLPPDLYRRQHRLEATVRQCLLLMGAIEDDVTGSMLNMLLRYESSLELEVVTSLCRWARGGDVLADAALSPKSGDRARKLAAIYINMHCIYHPENAPAMLRRVLEFPQRSGTDDYWTQVRVLHDTLLSLPDEMIVDKYRSYQVVAWDFRPATAWWQTLDNDLFDALTLYFPLTALFPAGEEAAAAQRAWARHLRELPEPRRPRSQIETVVRSGPPIGRNDRCPCGSGRKYKHCCLRTPRPEPTGESPTL